MVLNSKERASINYNLEALRGLAASMVVWHHVIVHPQQLDPVYIPTGVAAFNAPGHFAVLIFFLLSGFVIGKSQPEPLQRTGVATYLRKRFVRLYPIYLLAILAGVVAAGFRVPLITIGQHMLFLQGWGAPVIFENNPLWSLQHEVLFYLAFIPLSIYSARPWVVALVSAALSLFLLILNPDGAGAAVAQYLIGFAFWATGWTLSTLTCTEVPAPSPRLLSAFLLMLGIEYLNPLTTVASRIVLWLQVHQITDTTNWMTFLIRAIDYASLPYAALIVVVAASRLSPGLRVASLLLQILPLVGVINTIRYWADPGVHSSLLPCLFYLVSLVFYFLPDRVLPAFSRTTVQCLAFLGAFSYGLYVIHFPILVAFHNIPFFAGTPASFIVRATLYIPLAFAVGYWLDKRFQPWVKNKIEAL
ncbi:acyltransferase [Hymenobacter taeanensis]|uniref:Acyltransferase n=1 Tax=Hymenobacter taeanensis TaxID=2735321 RepID=A0A6M6BKD9_9BACT|nr:MULTISPECIES: acyltransferase [Hymenobacter]QJX48294.1 acyltransferase [Hymenobacter taeanensis]UOQ82217.1 acyltransferase [Hymenobacter sp. 5414T-23]